MLGFHPRLHLLRGLKGRNLPGVLPLELRVRQQARVQSGHNGSLAKPHSDENDFLPPVPDLQCLVALRPGLRPLGAPAAPALAARRSPFGLRLSLRLRGHGTLRNVHPLRCLLLPPRDKVLADGSHGLVRVRPMLLGDGREPGHGEAEPTDHACLAPVAHRPVARGEPKRPLGPQNFSQVTLASLPLGLRCLPPRSHLLPAAASAALGEYAAALVVVFVAVVALLRRDLHHQKELRQQVSQPLWVEGPPPPVHEILEPVILGVRQPLLPRGSALALPILIDPSDQPEPPRPVHRPLQVRRPPAKAQDLVHLHAALSRLHHLSGRVEPPYCSPGL